MRPSGGLLQKQEILPTPLLKKVSQGRWRDLVLQGASASLGPELNCWGHRREAELCPQGAPSSLWACTGSASSPMQCGPDTKA